MDAVKTFFTTLWTIIKDNSFIVIAILTLLIVALIVMLMIKHMPNKGRIIDVYDASGKKVKKHKKK